MLPPLVLTINQFKGSVSTRPISYPISVNEFPQRLTKFICGFCKCHSVCSNIFRSFFCHDITNFVNAANSEVFQVNTFVNFLFSFMGEKINKRLRRSIIIYTHETQSRRESCVFSFSHLILYTALHKRVLSTI